MCWVIRILPLQGSGRAQDMSKTVNVSTIYELHIVLRAHLTNQIQIRLLMIDTMMRTTSMTMDHTGDLCIEGQHRVLQVWLSGLCIFVSFNADLYMWPVTSDVITPKGSVDDIVQGVFREVQVKYWNILELDPQPFPLVDFRNIWHPWFTVSCFRWPNRCRIQDELRQMQVRDLVDHSLEELPECVIGTECPSRSCEEKSTL